MCTTPCQAVRVNKTNKSYEIDTKTTVRMKRLKK